MILYFKHIIHIDDFPLNRHPASCILYNIKWWRLKDQAVADDYAKDVINNMEDCELPEWTIFSETLNEKGSEHSWVTTGGKSMQKRESW